MCLFFADLLILKEQIIIFISPLSPFLWFIRCSFVWWRINYPTIRWPEVPYQKHGLVPWTQLLLKTKNLMFQVIHCIVLLGVYQTYQTQSYLVPMQWENVEMIYGYILSQYSWLASWGPSEAILRVVSIEVTVQNESTSTEPSSARVVCNFGRIEVECWVVIHEFSPHFPQKRIELNEGWGEVSWLLIFFEPQHKKRYTSQPFQCPPHHHRLQTCRLTRTTVLHRGGGEANELE